MKTVFDTAKYNHEDKEKIEIGINEDDHEWVERIGKTAYDICNDPSRNSVKLNEQHTLFYRRI